MKLNLLLILVFLLGFFALTHAQEDEIPPFDENKVLSPKELNRTKWYYSLEEALREPENVYRLSLHGQKLKAFPSEIFRMTNLHVLDMSNNKIKLLPSQIEELQYLQFLSLYKNKLRFLPDNMKNLGQLHTLFLGRNKIIEIPAWVGGLGQLRKLDLVYNRLTPYDIKLLQSRLPRCRVTPDVQ